MRLKLPARANVWTRRGVYIIEGAFVLFFLGLVLQSTRLLIAAATILSYVALAQVFQSDVPSSIGLQRRLQAQRVTEGELITTEAVITNASRTSSVVRVLEEYPDGLELVEGSTNYFAFVASGTQETVCNVIKPDFRGHYLLRAPVALVTDELNLRARKVENVGKASYLTVLPPIEDLSDFPMGSRTSQPEIGAYRSGSVGVGTEFFGIRGYLPGDDLRRINWKASARTDYLLSNEYEREHVTNIYLIVDMTSPAKKDLKWVVNASASMATYLLKTRNRLGLIVLGEGVSHVRIESGRRQLLRVLDKLVTVEPGGTGEVNAYLKRLIDEMPRCETFLVSPVRSAEIADTAIEVRSRQEHLCVITCRETGSQELERDLVLKVAKRLYDLERAAVMHRIKNADVRIIEVPFGTPIRSAVSLIEERPLRR